jgi:hypothetical protein
MIPAVLVGDDLSYTLTAYSVGSWTPTARVQLRGAPFAVAVDPTTDRVFVADEFLDALSILNGSTLAVEQTIPLPYQPTVLVFDPSTDDVAVTSFDDNNVTIVNVTAGVVVANISVPLPTSIAADPALGELYVTSWGGEVTGGAPALVAIDERTNLWTDWVALNATSGYYSAGFDPVDGRLYVGVDGATQYFDPSTLDELGTLPGASGGSLVIDAESEVVFVAGALQTLAYASTTDLELGSFVYSTYAGSIAVDPTTSELFVQDPLNGTIGIGTLGPSIGSFAAAPPRIALGESTQLETILAAESGSAVASYPILPPGCTSANTLDLTCAPDASGTFPAEISVTDGSGLTVVAETNATVSGPAISATYTVNFTESGLGASAPWTVTVNGTPVEGTGLALSIQGPNGSYSYTVSATGYSATPSRGTFPVPGAPVDVRVGFTAVAVRTTGYLTGSVIPVTALSR